MQPWIFFKLCPWKSSPNQSFELRSRFRPSCPAYKYEYGFESGSGVESYSPLSFFHTSYLMLGSGCKCSFFFRMYHQTHLHAMQS